MAIDYSLSGNNPIYPINWSGIFSNLPKANIGMVPVGMGEKYGMNRPEMEYANPTNWRAKQVMHPDEWWKDEPIGINTELKMTPYNKFFPYEEDYSGIMSAKALQEQGGNIYDISKTQPENFGVHMPYYQEVGLNLENLDRDPKNIQSTLFHEAKHYYLNKYGIDITKLPTNRQHELIEQAQGMFYKKHKGQYSPLLDKYAANLFTKMHQRGKQWSQDPQPFGKGKISPIREQTIQAEKLKEEQINAFADPNDTVEQVLNQIQAYEDKDRGNYQAPTMTQQQMVQEAQQTGGTVNPHEATKAAWTPPSSQPVRGPNLTNRAQGGMVSINNLTRRL